MKTFHKPIPILSLFALLLVVVWACRKEKPGFDLSDKDPCSCASEVSAEFVIEELATNIPEQIWDETDTCNRIATMRFTAMEENASYKWYVGSEVLFGRSVARLFGEQWVGYDIPITLVVTKNPNSTCFPDDDGYDSITKSFYVSEYPIYDYPNDEIYHPIEGTYRVIGEGMTDSIEVSLNMRFFTTTQNRVVDIENSDGLGTICVGDEYSLGRKVKYISYRRLNFGDFPAGSNNFCLSVSGTILCDNLDRVSLQLRRNSGFPMVETTWFLKGRKIN